MGPAIIIAVFMALLAIHEPKTAPDPEEQKPEIETVIEFVVEEPEVNGIKFGDVDWMEFDRRNGR